MEIHQEIENTLKILQQGGIILYPADTIWGIGCDATNPEAVSKIYKLKTRSETKSMICLVSGERMLYQIFDRIPETAWQIMELSEKPTTLILDKPKNVAGNLITDDNTLGVRIVKEPFCFKLIEQLKKPLVSTSANLSGASTPYSFQEISTEILKGVDYVVNLRRDKICKQASTIIKLTLDNQVKIIRK
ncbi:MAG: threonylcarbamoyl-AMP synthase [Flavobacteriales bacterium CG_4_9_14_3_um_filter_40_17]|nr:MAG: threonylcarbamoyl-AMP synthase [Flavobacteriales bacterium CG_4_9_14_3_um_filter_40_17]